MANLMFKTKGMVNPKGKPRVYFKMLNKFLTGVNNDRKRKI